MFVLWDKYVSKYIDVTFYAICDWLFDMIPIIMYKLPYCSVFLEQNGEYIYEYR